MGVIMLGLNAYNVLPKESVPDISINTFLVQTIYTGASVQDVESLITNPIEDVLESLDDVTDITSDSQMGTSQIMVSFEEGADMDQAEIDISKELNSLNLPEGAMDPFYIRFETGEMPIMSMTLTGDYNLTDLKVYAEILEDEMESISGIKSVDVSGGYDREIRVVVDFNSLSEYGVDINSVKNALQLSNINMPAGSKTLDKEEYNIRVDESFKSIEDIKNLVIYSNQKGTIFLSDVAEVSDSFKDPSTYSSTYVKGTNSTKKSTPAIYLTVFRESGYDIIGPATEIRELMDEAAGTLYPEDVVMLITSDQSVDVERDLNTVINNALSGLLTVIVVLFIFIGLNESLIVAAVIPLSLFISFVVMQYTGMTFNSISLLGYIIALGLLVDNAIVVMENVDRLREEGLDRNAAAKIGSNQVGPAIFAATITTICAFLPIAIMPGMIGKFLGIMPRAVMYTIGASLVVSVLITPALCARFLPKFKKDGKKYKLPKSMKNIVSVIFVMALVLFAFSDGGNVGAIPVIAAIFFGLLMILKEWIVARREKHPERPSFTEKYRVFVYSILQSWKKKALVLGLSFAVFVMAIMSIPMGILELELFPVEDPTSLTINIETPIGSLMEDTQKVVDVLEAKLFEYEEMESFSITIGQGGGNSMLGGGSGKNVAKIDVELIPIEDRSKTGNEIVTELRAVSKAIPGTVIEIEGASEMGPPTSGKDISLGIKGNDLEQVQQYAEMYYDILTTVEGVQEVAISTADGLKEVNIDIDNNRATHYGLNISSISQEIRNRISGTKVGVYKEEGDEYDVSIYYPEDRITSLSDIENMYFKANSGALIPFSEFAEITLTEGMEKISHENGKRIVTIDANVDPDLNATVVSKKFEELIAHIELPKGVERVTGGQMEDMAEQTGNLMFSFIVALLLVYIVLVIQFNSLLQPIVIMFSVPFALIGVFFGLIVTGNNLGMYAMMGTVALVGIAVNDAIVLIDYTNYLRGIGVKTKEAVAEAVKTRFIPVIATSLTTIGGVLPLAIYNKSFSQLGYAIIFGLFASTVLTLLIVPILYNGIHNVSKKFTEKTGLMTEDSI